AERTSEEADELPAVHAAGAGDGAGLRDGAGRLAELLPPYGHGWTRRLGPHSRHQQRAGDGAGEQPGEAEGDGLHPARVTEICAGRARAGFGAACGPIVNAQCMMQSKRATPMAVLAPRVAR